jgi:hypothetical protein
MLNPVSGWMCWWSTVRMTSRGDSGSAEVKTIWSLLFRHFEWELAAPHPKRDFSAIVVGPVMPCMIKYKRKVQKK